MEERVDSLPPVLVDGPQLHRVAGLGDDDQRAAGGERQLLFRPGERRRQVAVAGEQQRRNRGQFAARDGRSRLGRPVETRADDPVGGRDRAREGPDRRRLDADGGVEQRGEAVTCRRAGPAPRHRVVGAQRGGVETLAERLGRRPRVGREAVDEPLEVGPPAVGRGVERPDHTGVGRVEDAQSDQRVEEPRIDARRPHDERELLGRIPLAGQVAAQGTQHPPDRARVLDRQPVDPHVGNDRVEDEPGDVRRVPQRIPLCDEGPVRHAVEVQLVDPERAAEQIEVLHRLVGAEEPALRADRAGAGRHRRLRRRGEVGAAHLGLESLGTGVRWGPCRAGRSGRAGSRRARAEP